MKRNASVRAGEQRRVVAECVPGREQQQATTGAVPAQVVPDEGGDLRYRKDEDEIPEELDGDVRRSSLRPGLCATRRVRRTPPARANGRLRPSPCATRGVA